MNQAAQFAFTPDVLRWISKHAQILNTEDMAAHLGCAPRTIETICQRHAIILCAASDRHSDIARVPGAPEPALEPTQPITAPARRTPAKVHPRLDPALRRNLLSSPLQLKPQGNAVSLLEREAARRSTTAAILATVIVEIVAVDDLFNAVLNLDE